MAETNSTPQKIYLKDYISPAYKVDNIKLDFNLNDDFCTLRSTLNITQLRKEPLILNGADFKLISMKINGEEIPAQHLLLEPTLATIKETPEKFSLEVVTQLEPQNNTSLEGLYKSNGIFCTQCEAQGFRKMTYYMDRPDVMTQFHVTIEADKSKYPVLLSNGDRISVEDLDNGRHKATWNDPHKKPCYLFALIAGDLGVIKDQYTTTSGKKVNLEIYAPHGKQDRCHHGMESLKKSMKWDEDTFGLEYDLNDYMIVAIDDFNAGAMENKGLNIFNSKLVLADSKSATDTDFHNIESVVAHEYFHNWTGNRVTVSSWFQLSLKEGLTVFRDQEFSADMTDRGVQRIQEVNRLRDAQFAEDSGPNAHSVRPESCMAVDNFYTATIYEKGSELIRMMQTLVGRKGFRKGMDEYFRRHDGQAVTTEDFANAISEANGKDFSQFKLWYSQAGTPHVKLEENYSEINKEFSITLSQSTPNTPGQMNKKPFHIPILIELLDKNGNHMELNCDKISINTDGAHLIELKSEKETFTFKNVTEKPVLSILRQFSAPIKLDWKASDEDLFFLMEKDTDLFNQREAAYKLAQNMLMGNINNFISGKPLSWNLKFFVAMKEVLKNEKLDTSFKDLMLQFPGYDSLAQNAETLNAEAFKYVRESFIQELTKVCEETLLEIYKSYHGFEATSTNAKSFGHRSLKNRSLFMLCQLEPGKYLPLAQEQFSKAVNMTDKMAALGVLAQLENPMRDEALNSFFEEWKHDALVMNKWFNIQATTTGRNTLEDVKHLVKHSSFNIKNPNNVYSLIRAFGYNVVQFYKKDGEAFRFLIDQILEVDKINPQVAARICAAFNYVKKLDSEVRVKAESEIRRALDSEISKNTRELLINSI